VQRSNFLLLRSLERKTKQAYIFAIMTQHLTHLNALKTFEVVARHQSVRKAAEELNVTPAAVSHQVKKLEEYFGVALFSRHEGRFELSQVGHAALPKLQEGFENLSLAVQQLRAVTGRRTLRVLAAPSFAAKWVAPRLNRFLALQPDIDIELSSSADLISENVPPTAISAALRQKEVDIAIPFGRGRFPGCKATKLMSVEAVPLCSPGYLEQVHLEKPADLLEHTLLHDNTRYPENPTWSDWMALAGLNKADGTRGIHFDHAVQALEAAIGGQGVALSLKPLATADLAAGRLVIPFDIVLPLKISYYMVQDQGVPDKRVEAFRDWVMEEAALGT
jgi:LysR family transcriptional regulator, glycine cleavage system transcriptional activator